MGLKLLAVFAMVVDHLNIVFFDRAYWAATLFGRLAFPIFGYLVVYNLLYRTSDPRRYLARLWLFALISQPVYRWAFPQHHELNVFFILAIGGTMVWLMENGRFGAAALVAPLALFADYYFGGLAFMLAVYAWMRWGERPFVVISLLLSMLFMNDLVYALYVPVAFWLLKNARRVENWVAYRPSFKHFFYLFYPAHLALLAAFA